MVIRKWIKHYSEFNCSIEQSTKCPKLKHSQIEVKMKIFQRILKYLAVMGLTPNQKQWNIRQICCLVLCSSGVIAFGVNISVGVINMQESMQSFFMAKGLLAIVLCFISSIFNNDKLFELIEDIRKELSLSGY